MTAGESSRPPRGEIAAKAQDWTAVHKWLNARPDLRVSLVGDAVMIHELNEAEATRLLLDGAKAGTVSRSEASGYVVVTRAFGTVAVRAMCRVPKSDPVVLNPETAA